MCWVTQSTITAGDFPQVLNSASECIHHFFFFPGANQSGGLRDLNRGLLFVKRTNNLVTSCTRKGHYSLVGIRPFHRWLPHISYISCVARIAMPTHNERCRLVSRISGMTTQLKNIIPENKVWYRSPVDLLRPPTLASPPP